MTNLQYLQIQTGGFNISTDELTLWLTDAQLDPYADADEKADNLLLYYHFSSVLRQMACNVSEGGMSVSWNMEAVKLFYNQLCNETGKQNVLFDTPRIRNRSNIW